MVVGQTAPVREEYETADPELASENLTRMYPGIRLHPDVRGLVQFGLQSVVAGPVRIDRIQFGIEGRAVSLPIDYVLSFIPTAGSAAVSGSHDDVRLGPGEPMLCPIGVAVEYTWTSSFDEVLVPMSLESVAHRAAAAFGIEPGELRFTAMTPISAAMSRYWCDTVDYLRHEMSANDSSLAHPLVQAQAIDVLAAGLLATFPNTALLADHTRTPGRVGPAVLRRAMAFVDANAERPITVAEIADAAGIGVRALQKAFVRRRLNVTPMGYARRVRLERAHTDLQDGDLESGATVKAIAARWGFGQPDRFSAMYRARFGVSPSLTLRG